MADAQFGAHVGRHVVVVGVGESDLDVDDDFGEGGGVHTLYCISKVK